MKFGVTLPTNQQSKLPAKTQIHHKIKIIIFRKQNDKSIL